MPRAHESIARKLRVWLALACWLVWVGVHGATLPQDPAAPLFALPHLLEVRIEISTNDWEKLRREHRDLLAALGPERFSKLEPECYHTYPASVSIDGVRFSSVGLRKRGFLGSSSFQRPSLGIRLNEFVATNRLHGLKRISLNNNLQDSSLVHQALAYAVFARAGVPAPRCNFARVTVNGQYLGIYSHVEAVEEGFLKRRFGDSSGHLYEGLLSDFRPDWVKTFERKNHKEDAGREDLEAMVQALQREDAQLLAGLEPILDLEAYLDYWAVESLIGHWDSYSNNGNNFFVYRVPSTGRFQFIPWGADGTMGDADPFTQVKTPASVMARSLLPSRLYKLPATRERYRSRLSQILATNWNETQLLAEVDRMEAMLAPHVTNAKGPFRAGLEKVRNFIRTRRAALEPELAGSAPEYPLPPKPSGCIEKVGRLEGSFDSVWRGRTASNQVAKSSVVLRSEIEGRKQSLRSPTLFTTVSTEPRSAGCPTITLMAGEWLSGDAATMILVFQPEVFHAGTQPIDGFSVGGYFFRGRLWKADSWRFGLMLGTVDLTAAGTELGAPLQGRIKADIYKIPQ